jgi:hypothetical protein
VVVKADKTFYWGGRREDQIKAKLQGYFWYLPVYDVDFRFDLEMLGFESADELTRHVEDILGRADAPAAIMNVSGGPGAEARILIQTDGDSVILGSMDKETAIRNHKYSIEMNENLPTAVEDFRSEADHSDVYLVALLDPFTREVLA